MSFLNCKTVFIFKQHQSLISISLNKAKQQTSEMFVNAASHFYLFIYFSLSQINNEHTQGQK